MNLRLSVPVVNQWLEVKEEDREGGSSPLILMERSAVESGVRTGRSLRMGGD